jgi:hypothetical protein
MLSHIRTIGLAIGLICVAGETHDFIVKAVAQPSQGATLSAEPARVTQTGVRSAV